MRIYASVFNTSVLVIIINLAAIVIGCIAGSRLVVRPMLEHDPTFSITAIQRNCYPWNGSAVIWFYQEPMGFRSPPNVRAQNDNLAGTPFSIYTNFEGALVSSDSQASTSKFNAPLHIYGDSFGAGDEVNYSSAWYAELGDVGNFSIYGGAPDQALEYLKFNLSKGFRPRTVILQMIPENVNRLWNIYHCLLFPTTGMSMATKPRYIVANDGIALFPAPQTRQNWDAVVTERDFWGRRAKLIESMLSSRNDFQLLYNLLTNLEMLRDPHGYLLKSPETSAMLRHILSEFSRLARTYQFTPHFLLLPTTGVELTQYVNGATTRRFTQSVQRICRETGVDLINAFEFLNEEFAGSGEDAYNIIPNRGHMSIAANAAVGRLVRQSLRAPPLGRGR